MSTGLAAWHACFAEPTEERLADMIADGAVFHSPVVHTPQKGKALVMAYLGAAAQVFGTVKDFRYVDEIVSADGAKAMLEFVTEMDGVHVNGIDIIHWDDHGKIVEFKVLIRPLKAVNKVWEKMGEMLDKKQV